MEANVKLLAGKQGIVFGVANQRSIAWAIAKAWHEAGGERNWYEMGGFEVTIPPGAMALDEAAKW